MAPRIEIAGRKVRKIDDLGIASSAGLRQPGGNALKFYASVRLDIRKIGVVKNGDLVVGTKTRVKVVNAPTFREAELVG